MRELTKNIGSSDKYNLVPDGDLVVKKILIVRPNARLGNQLLITPLVQEIMETFPDCSIDLFVKGDLAPLLFRNYKNIDKIIQLPEKPFSRPFAYAGKWLSLKRKRYDIVVNAVKNSSSGKLLTKFSSAKYKFFGYDANWFSTDDYLKHIAKIPVYDFRKSVTQLGFEYNTGVVPNLDLKLDHYELNRGKVQLKKLVQNQKKTICLFTYATGQKCYSVLWWLKFYAGLQQNHSEYNFIEILPATKKSNMDNTIPAYFSNDVREIAALIANSFMFIGADSGIMHLASASGAPTVGLFSCTETEVYMPYNDNSLALNTNKYSFDECLAIIKGKVERIAKAQTMLTPVIKKESESRYAPGMKNNNKSLMK